MSRACSSSSAVDGSQSATSTELSRVLAKIESGSATAASRIKAVERLSELLHVEYFSDSNETPLFDKCVESGTMAVVVDTFVEMARCTGRGGPAPKAHTGNYRVFVEALAYLANIDDSERFAEEHLKVQSTAMAAFLRDRDSGLHAIAFEIYNPIETRSSELWRLQNALFLLTRFSWSHLKRSGEVRKLPEDLLSAVALGTSIDRLKIARCALQCLENGMYTMNGSNNRANDETRAFARAVAESELFPALLDLLGEKYNSDVGMQKLAARVLETTMKNTGDPCRRRLLSQNAMPRVLTCWRAAREAWGKEKDVSGQPSRFTQLLWRQRGDEDEESLRLGPLSEEEELEFEKLNNERQELMLREMALASVHFVFIDGGSGDGGRLGIASSKSWRPPETRDLREETAAEGLEEEVSIEEEAKTLEAKTHCARRQSLNSVKSEQIKRCLSCRSFLKSSRAQAANGPTCYSNYVLRAPRTALVLAGRA